ncbi:hypothetical protein MMC10_005670 [Thelotrema lepadinum]|nr:hypothetical protein [Thelotrema lepadinum]
MDIQFLPNRIFQAPAPFLQQYLPGHLTHGRTGAYYPKSWSAHTGRGSRRAASILQSHVEELYYTGTSSIFPRALEKLWLRDHDLFTSGSTWARPHSSRAPFSSVFADLALLLSPDGELSSEYFFRIMANFLIRSFADMLDVSPQTAMICFSALDWMGHGMADVCATVGRDVGDLLEAMEDFPMPFPLRECTEGLLDEVQGSGSGSYYRRPYRDPWCFPEEDGRGVYAVPRRARMPLALGGVGRARGMGLLMPAGGYGSRPASYLAPRSYYTPTFGRQNLLMGTGNGYQGGHVGLPFLRHPHGNGYRLRLLH